MIIIQYIFGGLVILLALMFIGIGIYVLCAGIRNGFIPLLLGIIIASSGVIIITDKSVPTKQDVFDGKAVYQETIHITNNDTIKTYKIVWKQKN